MTLLEQKAALAGRFWQCPGVLHTKLSPPHPAHRLLSGYAYWPAPAAPAAARWRRLGRLRHCSAEFLTQTQKPSGTPAWRRWACQRRCCAGGCGAGQRAGRVSPAAWRAVVCSGRLGASAGLGAPAGSHAGGGSVLRGGHRRAGTRRRTMAGARGGRPPVAKRRWWWWPMPSGQPVQPAGAFADQSRFAARSAMRRPPRPAWRCARWCAASRIFHRPAMAATAGATFRFQAEQLAVTVEEHQKTWINWPRSARTSGGDWGRALSAPGAGRPFWLARHHAGLSALGRPGGRRCRFTDAYPAPERCGPRQPGPDAPWLPGLYVVGAWLARLGDGAAGWRAAGGHAQPRTGAAAAAAAGRPAPQPFFMARAKARHAGRALMTVSHMTARPTAPRMARRSRS